LIVARAIYVDDRRGIECLFVDPKGQFQVLILYLTKTEAGDIKIEDFRLAAHYLEFCRMMRHLLLVTRIPLPGVTDLEEINLEDFGKRSSAAVNAALQATAAGKWEEAFKSWDGVAPQMKTSRLWRDVRINLAFAGSVMAMADLQRDCRQGVGGNAFARLLILSAGGDKEVALAELEKVLIEYHELAFFRAMKADLLVELGRAAQALPLVLETIALCPRTPSAYLVGIRAATILGKQSLAMQLVRDLSQVIAGNEVDHLIESFSDLVQLRAVPEYQTWKKELLNKTSTTSSPAEKPTPRD
jgi:tetratricopeptide (TPR) repeat protein